MSDVLYTNAFREYARLNRCYIYSLVGEDTSGYAPPSFQSNCYCGTLYTCGVQLTGSTATGIDTSTFTNSWSEIPVLDSPTNGFKVCDTSGYYRCGAGCTWTVPAGVTCVQFQLWGPGGGTSSQCCCGGAPYGPTGAYATVLMSVTPGDVYCLCAGCAYCCYASQTTPGLVGSSSYAVGPKLSTFLAMSGISCICSWRQTVNSISSGCQIPTNDSCGPEPCSGWNFCWDSGADDGGVYYSYSSATTFSGTITCGDGQIYGINGLYPLFCIGSTFSGSSYTRGAPVYGFLNQSQCCFSYTGSSSAGCTRSFVFGSGLMPIPGAGGQPSYVTGGDSANGGDSGRMGMVCVRYCCG